MHARAAALFFPLTIGLSLVTVCARADTLDEIRRRGTLIWGADAEGGGPYVYPDPTDSSKNTGFEVELAEMLARELGVKAEFAQVEWTSLPDMLGTDRIDIVLNGYELAPQNTARMAASVPYYVYELALLVKRDDRQIESWKSFAAPAAGSRPRVGVLGPSAALTYLEEQFGQRIEAVIYPGNTDAMRDVETGQLDATVADDPVATFYADRFAKLREAGPRSGRGYYVAYVRPGDTRLLQAINAALARLIASGELRRTYERYGLWSPAQSELAELAAGKTPDGVRRGETVRGWAAIEHSGEKLLKAAGVTVVLAVCSMPLAIAIGLVVAIGRLYGPSALRWLLVVYVEVLRGTPLLLQLWFIFYVLPEFGWGLNPFYAAIAGLAINYSAYEAEVYRAGIQAIPRGQMEAALSLGMSPALALRRIIVPQAVRIVVPPVTNDFIALFKDTSVCSVITVIELTKEYSIQRNNTGATVELALLTAALYLIMSVPLSHLASRLERRLGPKSHH